MSRLILRPNSNGLLGWPEAWTRRFHNAINEPCDMLIGPCACGAWHHADEWGNPDSPCPRRIDGVLVLDFYDAKFAEPTVLITVPPEPLSLSYF